MPIELKGEKVDSLQTTGDLWIEVQLNKDAAASSANQGKNEPEHYRNVVGQSFHNAVIVQDDSIIQFKVISKGEFGFGYRIVGGLKLDAKNRVLMGAEPEIIARKLYCLPPVSANNAFELDETAELFDVLQRYQDAARSMIQIRSFKTLNWGPDDRGNMVAMMNCTVTSWGVYGFIDDATDIDYGHPADISSGNDTAEISAGGVATVAARSSVARVSSMAAAGFSDRMTSGSPARTAVGGGPVRRGTSSQVFTSARNIREVNPDQAPNYVNFSFLIQR